MNYIEKLYRKPENEGKERKILVNNFTPSKSMETKLLLAGSESFLQTLLVTTSTDDVMRKINYSKTFFTKLY